jgi:hypothetical protein
MDINWYILFTLVGIIIFVMIIKQKESFFNPEVNIVSDYPIMYDDHKRLDPEQWKGMLVRNPDGTVKLEQVPIGLPFEEIRRIYGPSVRKYLYMDTYEHPCDGYPTKRFVDSVGSNYFLPRVCKLCNDKNSPLLSSPSDPELNPDRINGDKIMVDTFIHPLKDVNFGPDHIHLKTI